MQNDASYNEPFQFLDLPAELREMVYENLLEEPCYPAQPQTANGSAPSKSSGPTQASGRKPSNWIFLANKQVYGEFMDLLVKKSTFHFSTYPDKAPRKASNASSHYASTAREASPDTTSQSMTLTSTPPWFIAPSTLTRLRNCTLTLNVTSSMLGCPDPRAMTPASWAFARSIKKQLSLSSTSSIQSLSLHVKAIGDPLWNPLWVWYHASQSFKSMGRLREIRFSLDTWSPGENHLRRDDASCSSWSWYCPKNHRVATELGADVTVRQFCAMLYQECLVCRPELEGSDGE
ncbi:hypothetical protein K491DRAFT_706060 [Lophiostoma macrostomum CBS 122681]|uniref:F-box domain-containing protein n=1 Tax=Lophiostoma macrostomum CBS 122681 TaxID=1314788 RepID=A0A6A6SZV2_9PLEO|nr:hypothetical protein K491DRAFT_706060 [Lophiostoma macrostomum CBS 122681]